MSTVEELIHVSAKYFNVPVCELTAESDFFEKLKLNSIQALNLLSLVEKKFNIEIPDYELQGVKTFQELAEVIDQKR